MRILYAALLLIFSAPAYAATWREAETTHFRIISSGDEKGLRQFAERLEYFHVLLRLATGANETSRPVVRVTVYLVPTIGDVKRLYGDTKSDVAGYYGPRDYGAIAVVPRTTGDGTFTGQLVLFHEYSHHYMLQYTPAAYPSWYVEGFAEIASTASFERKGAITFGKAASHRQYELDGGMNYPVIKMLDGTYLKDREKGRGWSYGDAWTLTHYLTFSDARRGQFRTYLSSINAGKKMADAAQVFGDLNALQHEVSSYLAGRSFPYRAVPIADGSAGTITVRQLSPAQAAVIDLTIELDRCTDLPTKGKDEEQGAFDQKLAKAKLQRDEWIAKVELAANTYPAETPGWLLLADARCSAEQYQACAAAADRALALVPDIERGLTRKAEAMIGLAKDLPADQRQAKVLAAQALLLKANLAQPNDPLALYWYYASFGAMGRPADAEGLMALITTVQLIPQLETPRLQLAQEFMQRGRLREARTILRPLAYSPHESSASKLARELLDKVDAALSAAGA